MTKFKAGDKAVLISVSPHWGVEVGTEVTIKAPFEGSAGAGYLVELCDKPGSCIYYAERRLGPVDDPLPPAPRSGVYCSHNNDRRVTLLLEDGLPEDVIAVGTDASFMKVRLTAETALVLAHDLTRMAMEIKRRERAQSGE